MICIVATISSNIHFAYSSTISLLDIVIYIYGDPTDLSRNQAACECFDRPVCTDIYH